MNPLRQLYDEQGRQLVGKGGSKDEVLAKGLLHGGSHVWVWRIREGNVEILLQKRAADKRTWPGKYDISAAGHIDLGEDPLTAALREAKEEIDLSIDPSDLKLIGVHRAHLMAGESDIENEHQWLYLLELPENTTFAMRPEEVASLEWKTLADFKKETKAGEAYVPHGQPYFQTIITAIEYELSQR